MYTNTRIERDRENFTNHVIIVELTNAGIVIHRRKDLVASPLDMIIWTYAAEHW